MVGINTENVVRLQVSVCNALLVKMLQGIGKAFDYLSGFSFCEENTFLDMMQQW